MKQCCQIAYLDKRESLMKLIETMLRKLVRQELARIDEAHFAEPDDHRVGRALKSAFRRAGGQRNLASLHVIRWSKAPDAIIANALNPPGEIGGVGYHSYDDVTSRPKRASGLWFGDIGLEVKGPITLAGLHDLRSGTSIPQVEDPERFGSRAAMKGFRKYPLQDLFFWFGNMPEEGYLGLGIAQLDADEMIETFRSLQGEDLVNALHDIGIATSPEQLPEGSFNEIIVAHPKPVAIWLPDGMDVPEDLRDLARQIPVHRFEPVDLDSTQRYN